MSKNIEDLLGEFSESEDSSEGNGGLRDSQIDLLLDSDDDDSHVLARAASNDLFGTREERGGSSKAGETSELTDKDLVERLIASNDSSDDDEEEDKNIGEKNVAASVEIANVG